ncbi:MAG: zinc-binding dehydrogenase [Candidatus Dormibacteraeota bacterium]|nr:zinc-binding dehydrogenase [Candidatus Dormibacteraeota bacterium]
MRAVVMREFGPPWVLTAEEVPDPVPAPDQALVEVAVASITFVETQVRAGRPPNPAMTPDLPAVLGNGVGGVVTAVGPGGDPDLIGRRVISTTGGRGGYAELAAVDTATLIAVPDEVGLAEATAILADGRTALSLMQRAPVRDGQVVLVEAAAGGVGALLVQLARRSGGRVVAAAGSPRKLEVARELGAMVTVDYTQPSWTEQLRADPGGLDLVFESVGGAIGRAAFELVRPGGRLVAFGAASGSFSGVTDAEAAHRQVTVVRGGAITPSEMVALSRAALEQMAAGDLRPVIGQTFPLEQAAAAHAAIEGRATLGKTLLVMDGNAGSLSDPRHPGPPKG